LFIATPEVCVRDINPLDEFVVLSTRSFWSAITPADAVEFVRDAFASGYGADDASRQLLELAKCSDAVVIVVKLCQ
jgi:hypothetical protein